MVSLDDIETNTRFAKEHEADFPILANPGKDVAAAYGVLNATGTAARRVTFYIGPDGKILFVENPVSASTAGEDMARRLGELGVKKKK